MPAGEPDRDVGINAVVEPEPVDQPIGGRKIGPGLAGSIFEGGRRYMGCHGRKNPVLNVSNPSLLRARRKGKTKLSTIDD
jgi:hypothetical protein